MTWVWTNIRTRNKYIYVFDDVVLFFATFTPRFNRCSVLRRASCSWQSSEWHLFSNKYISEKHLWRATAEEERTIDRTDTKCRENMQKGIALSHTELVSCNLPHEPVCLIRMKFFFFLHLIVHISKATLKLIQIHSFAIDIGMLIEYYSSVI